MSKTAKIGRWTELFGRPTSFKIEIQKAREISSQWRHIENSPHVEARLEFIPGHMTPIWGSDQDWLYVRRPNGIWKTRLPADLGDKRVLLCQNDGAGGVLGGLPLGSMINAKGGWFENEGADSIDAVEIDQALDAAHLYVDAEELGHPLWDFAESSASRSVVQAGEHFAHANLDFELQNDWLIAVDKGSGRRVAFDVSKNRVVKRKCLENILWLRFESAWMKAVDVHVEIMATATS